MNTLFPEKYENKKSRKDIKTRNQERYKNSAIPYLQRMLHSCESVIL